MKSTISEYGRTLATAEDFLALISPEERFVTENGRQTTVQYVKVDKEEFLFLYGKNLILQLLDNRRTTVKAITPELTTEYEEEIGYERRIELLTKTLMEIDTKVWITEKPQPSLTDQDKINMIYLTLDESIEPLIRKAITDGLIDELVKHNLHDRVKELMSNLLHSYDQMMKWLRQQSTTN